MQLSYSRPRDMWLRDKAIWMRRDERIKQALETNLADIHVLEETEALRIGRIAIASGLADVRATKAQLKKEFSVLAETFPKRAGRTLIEARKIASERLAARNENSNHER